MPTGSCLLLISFEAKKNLLDKSEEKLLDAYCKGLDVDR
jgi:hypothetical protein